VLDVGIGNPSTLDFLQPYSAKVFFLDLSVGDAESAAQKLSPYADNLFDVCLFWDLLQYLDPDRLVELNEALTPYIYSRTKGYCIWDLNAAINQQRSGYKLVGQDELALVGAPYLEMRAWSYVDFAARFDSFRIAQDCLSPDGHLELLLEVD